MKSQTAFLTGTEVRKTVARMEDSGWYVGRIFRYTVDVSDVYGPKRVAERWCVVFYRDDER